MTSPPDWFMGQCMTSNPTSSRIVPRETFSPLSDYVALLLKWNSKINLIGPAAESDIWSRHIDDSLQLLPLIPESATSLADLGSGAGLPGMVIAISRPDLQVTLVEQDQRKAAFLNETKHLLQLSNVSVEAINITKLNGSYNVITARALASLSQLLSYSKPLMKSDSICLFPKGANHLAEVTEASQKWRFEHSLKTSATNDNSSIVILSNVTEIR
jgi:16S rRNA (guanine527-N7)-methyltransferase